MPKAFVDGKIKLSDADIYAELGIDKSSKATKSLLLGHEQVDTPHTQTRDPIHALTTARYYNRTTS